MAKESLIGITSRAELAEVLGVKESTLTFLLYKLSEDDKYSTFSVQKRNGGVREISAPVAGLKSIQRKLAEALLEVYPGRSCVHGFVPKKNIKSNASSHCHRKWIVNIDLKDFFPTIHYGRVKGLFENRPFCYPGALARELANLCCKGGVLPQGAPTSPIISNFICWRLDNQLQQLAKGSKCFYTRYADDITFSSNLSSIPPEIGVIDEDKKLVLSKNILDIVNSNCFELNLKKNRYAFRWQRQEVTGLIINSGNTNVPRKFVMQVREMIHSWERYGLEKAAEEHFNKYNYKHKEVADKPSSFINEIIGKLGYIRYVKRYSNGSEVYDSTVYSNLVRRLKALKPDANIFYNLRAIESADKPMIFCEGKTDWLLLKTALQKFRGDGDFLDLDVTFREYGPTETAGVSKLIAFCNSETVNDMKHIGLCVFDRDDNSVNKVIPVGCEYAYKGHNIYAMYLPVPSFRAFNDICIEHLFSDKEIVTEDEHQRRLYLSTEFDKETGIHLSNPDLSYRIKGHLQAKYPRILDSGVIDSKTGRNVALPKREFAYNIANAIGDFANFSFEGFRPFFEIVRKILHESK